MVNTYSYDSYGNAVLDINAVAQPFGYTARERTRTTGLHHCRARSYDAEAGRFLQENPLCLMGGDLNVMRYVGSNPAMQFDPVGCIARYGLPLLRIPICKLWIAAQ